MEEYNIYKDREYDNDYEPEAVVRIKLWDKLILLFRRFDRYLIPVETVWGMFNLDSKKEAVRICDYANLSSEAFTWIKTREINGQEKTLCMELGAVPYYLSTVPTRGMDKDTAEVFVRISEIAWGKLADHFRIGRNNLDKRFEYLNGLDEFLYDMEKRDREDGQNGEDIKF